MKAYSKTLGALIGGFVSVLALESIEYFAPGFYNGVLSGEETRAAAQGLITMGFVYYFPANVE